MHDSIRRVRVGLEGRYGLLLVSLTASFVIAGLDSSRWVALAAALLNVLSLVIGLATTDLRLRSTLLLALVGLGVGGGVVVWAAPVDSLAAGIGATAHAALLGLLTWAIVRAILSVTEVTVQTILGAIAVYFLVGQLFAWIYLALGGYLQEPVLEPSVPGEVPVYYSFVVLTTLGFGDVTPAGSFAERVTVLEALLGQIVLAVFVARLVSGYSQSR